MTARENFEKWMSYEQLEPKIKDELIAIKDNESEITERFSVSLEFGTDRKSTRLNSSH